MKPLLEAHQISKNYKIKGQTLTALKEVSFTIGESEIVGLCGESGSGKTTLGKILMGLIPITSGTLFFEGNPLNEKRNKALCQKIQMIFQHPASSLDPQMSVEKILSEPFAIHSIDGKRNHLEDLMRLLHLVGLSEDYLRLTPKQLSGGQKQRIAIARSLALNPRLLICDEPFSALDVTIQAQVINLLMDIHHEHRLSYLIISHDLAVLRYMAQKLLILYLGQMMEYGATAEIFKNPLHPYTQTLLASILSIKTDQKKTSVFIKGEIPSVLKPLEGCPFYSRCPHASKACAKTPPPLKEVREGHSVACFLY